MNLSKKKEIASKALKVGKNRIVFNTEALTEIKEAITKQDIKDLLAEGIITIKPVKGRKKIVKRKTRRGPGKIKKRINTRKQTYVKITRKLRAYLKALKDQGMLTSEVHKELRKKIRMRNFRSKAHLKEYLKTTDRFGIRPEKIIKELPEEKRLLEKDAGKKKAKKTTKKKEVKKETKRLLEKDAGKKSKEKKK